MFPKFNHRRHEGEERRNQPRHHKGSMYTQGLTVTSLPTVTPRPTVTPSPSSRPVVTPLATTGAAAAGAPSGDTVRFVCLSDTHTKTDTLPFKIPDGDVLIHAGDFTRKGTPHEAQTFDHWLSYLPHMYKVVIAGNHDRLFDKNFQELPVDSKHVLRNAIYLQDQHVTLYGIKIYGSPWIPEYRGCGFNLPRGTPLLEKWLAIPEDTDVLVTHTPPLGHGDFTKGKEHAGCQDLLNVVQRRVKPKYHVFGHIHEGYGTSNDGTTVFINASTCNTHYRPVNNPVVFDLPVPPRYRDKCL